MYTPGAYSWQEITTQGASWQAAVAAAQAAQGDLLALLRNCAEPSARQIVFIGCGSTYYLAQYMAPWFQRVTGWACRALPSSELLFQTEEVLPAAARPLVVALSRSGETSETILAVGKMRARGSAVLTVSCYADTPLAAASDYTLSLPAAREQSFAQTRSFASMLVATQTIGALLSGDAALLAELAALPSLATALMARAQPLAQQYGAQEAFKRITYLGSGALYGLAGEATVKMKEMSLSVAEAYHFMEFRHGPMSLVDGEHLVVALLSEAMAEYEVAVLRDLRERGCHILGLAEEAGAAAVVCDEVFALHSRLGAAARGVLYLPLLQLLAYYRALGRGLNPDRPRNVVMAVRLQGARMI